MRKSLRNESKEVGELRSSQLITSFGVGAMADFRDETVILAGADDWYHGSEADETRVLRCHNLEMILHRAFFVKPRFDRQNRAMFKRSISHDVGAYRFPRMLYCPSCSYLVHETELAGFQKGALYCPRCNEKNSRLVPSRFIVICRHGHLDDFPYSAWVHHGKPCEKQTGALPRMKLFHINGRTNLGSLMVSCEDCGVNRKMQEAFVPGALGSVYRCTGKRPWLEMDNTDCAEKPEVRMRNATGVYMPVNVSALNIPPWSAKISKLLLRAWDAMEGKSPEALRAYIEVHIAPYVPSMNLSQILKAYERLKAEDSQNHPASFQELYEEEYQALCGETEDEQADFCSRRLPVPPKYERLISGVTAVDRLTEIVAMVGFTRLQRWDGSLESPCLAPVFSKPNHQWLPAVDMHGEGVFLQLNEAALEKWEKKNAAIYSPMMRRVEENKFPCENASPRYVLLHTLAHLLIRALAANCGYQAASMKERIYSTYEGGVPMAGVLIYTASSDADGSLGGLVAQAAPEHLEEALDRLLNEAEWCSGDPLCMTSTGEQAQGLYGLNYAACHQCALLPETSCVMRNLLLDRAALIGREEDGAEGFFEKR